MNLCFELSVFGLSATHKEKCFCSCSRVLFEVVQGRIQDFGQGGQLSPNLLKKGLFPLKFPQNCKILEARGTLGLAPDPRVVSHILLFCILLEFHVNSFH